MLEAENVTPELDAYRERFYGRPDIDRGILQEARRQTSLIVADDSGRAKAIRNLRTYLRRVWPRVPRENVYACGRTDDHGECTFATANPEGFDVCPLHAALYVY